MNNDEETWRPVPSYPGIVASSWGRVHRVSTEGLAPQGGRSVPTFGTIARQVSSTGREYVKRTVQWKGYGRLVVSRLICEAFHGPAPFPGAIVMHEDDDATNNFPSNIQWATIWQNLSTSSSKPIIDAARKANAQAPRRRGTQIAVNQKFPLDLSGPSLRAFMCMSRDWRLAESIQCDLLGGPKPLTLRLWLDAARFRQRVRVPDAVLIRITVLIQTRVAIRRALPDPDDQASWLRTARRDLEGRTPLQLMCESSHSMVRVRDLVEQVTA